MNRLARLLGWATLFAVPAWWLMPPYQRAIGWLAARILSLGGLEIEFEEIEVAAPFDLALYAALCLASLEAPRGERLRALVRGLPVLIVVEVLAITVTVIMASGGGSAVAAGSGALRLSGYLLETIPWFSALLLWLAWLGRDELTRR